MINNRLLEHLYGANAAEAQKERYENAVTRFTELFGRGEEPHLFRAPGRIEIGGNHTDHQHGQVLAAAIDLDTIAAAAVSKEDDEIRIFSEGFGWIEADQAREGTPGALVHGMAEEMRLRGYKTGGVHAYVASSVPEGAGLSSSAAFEVLMGVILNSLFNDGGAAPDEIAHMAQTAENQYYGKPAETAPCCGRCMWRRKMNGSGRKQMP